MNPAEMAASETQIPRTRTPHLHVGVKQKVRFAAVDAKGHRKGKIDEARLVFGKPKPQNDLRWDVQQVSERQDRMQEQPDGDILPSLFGRIEPFKDREDHHRNLPDEREYEIGE